MPFRRTRKRTKPTSGGCRAVRPRAVGPTSSVHRVPAAVRTVRRLGRDPELVRAVASYALFTVSEYAVWIAVLVFAYGQGGATTAGLVAFAQLVPAALVAPFVSAVADRRLPGQTGGLHRTTRSFWQVVGGCLAGHSHGSGPEYHRRDESALDFG